MNIAWFRASCVFQGVPPKGLWTLLFFFLGGAPSPTRALCPSFLSIYGSHPTIYAGMALDPLVPQIHFDTEPRWWSCLSLTTTYVGLCVFNKSTCSTLSQLDLTHSRNYFTRTWRRIPFLPGEAYMSASTAGDTSHNVFVETEFQLSWLSAASSYNSLANDSPSREKDEPSFQKRNRTVCINKGRQSWSVDTLLPLVLAPD